MRELTRLNARLRIQVPINDIPVNVKYFSDLATSRELDF
jgi:hypothetical protein